ncbi:response regulator [Roseisalinus antarcticus]|uniref:Response regulator MprA n=1 Tax=Roseisalinus antarcticus TaxID=254357 RepID=A0A1Y5SNA2_9RHOB|nr:response regulator [Roseisalinus antarcticus]SLN44588.1 Response regulator MprA [Roseisalinus antarcticus]
MRLLIVEDDIALCQLWGRHLARAGHEVTLCHDGRRAIDLLCVTGYDVIVLDLVLSSGSALGVAEYAEVRQPEAKVMFVTNTTFFSDGSIFALNGNACAYLPTDTLPEDLAAMVEHHGR